MTKELNNSEYFSHKTNLNESGVIIKLKPQVINPIKSKRLLKNASPYGD